MIFFQDDKSGAKKIIVSVKGGAVTVAQVRELAHVVEREKAKMGLLVTLTNPTRAMLAEASRVGFYEAPHGAAFPKLQVLTVEGLLAGTERPRYPDLALGALTFKKAGRDQGQEQQQGLFEVG